jgi:plastocyanin
MSEFRKRVLVPAALPIVAAGAIGVLALAFSRVLLAVPEAGSTILAMLLAAMILAVCGVIAASGSGLKRSQRVLALFGGVAMLGAGVAGASIGIREIAPHGLEVEVAAEGIKFDTETISLPANTEVSLVFVNNDANTPHDIDIFADDSFSPPALFDGEIFTGIATKTYTVPPLEVGTYAFRCSIHVNEMTGTVAVEEGAGGGHGAPSGSTGEPLTEAEIHAEALAFDVTSLAFKADEAIGVTLVNADTAPHDFSIWQDETFSGDPLFDGENANPGETKTYAIDPIPAGEYAFKCTIHPDMKGSVTFS